MNMIDLCCGILFRLLLNSVTQSTLRRPAKLRPAPRDKPRSVSVPQNVVVQRGAALGVLSHQLAGSPRAAQTAIAGDPMPHLAESRQLSAVDVDHHARPLPLVMNG